ncbi:MAG TPA: hypothetical protein VGN14_18775 [Candidatus Elarobacter sp.]
MRRLLVVLVAVLFACPLLAQAQTPTYSAKPSVIVFPFTPNGSSIDREATSQIATLIATQMANTKWVKVIPPPPGTDRKDFLSVARSNGAEYYVSGFISALGDGASLVEQVVSSASGIVVFSNTAQLTTVGDVAGQGDDLALVIARHANRAYASIATPPPAATPTPAPNTEAQTNLSKLFGRKKKPAAAATAAPAAAAADPKPAAVVAVAAVPKTTGVAVVPMGGNAEEVLRTAAYARLVEKSGAEKVADAAAACGAHPHDAILSGSLWKGNGGPSFELVATDCAGKRIWRGVYNQKAAAAAQETVAAERAVDAALTDYNKRRRRG